MLGPLDRIEWLGFGLGVGIYQPLDTDPMAEITYRFIITTIKSGPQVSDPVLHIAYRFDLRRIQSEPCTANRRVTVGSHSN